MLAIEVCLMYITFQELRLVTTVGVDPGTFEYEAITLLGHGSGPCILCRAHFAKGLLI
jgi:hypothetical protein